jgi:hypothetical protein
MTNDRSRKINKNNYQSIENSGNLCLVNKGRWEVDQKEQRQSLKSQN